jgi:hypothetical protein
MILMIPSDRDRMPMTWSCIYFPFGVLFLALQCVYYVYWVDCSFSSSSFFSFLSKAGADECFAGGLGRRYGLVMRAYSSCCTELFVLFC